MMQRLCAKLAWLVTAALASALAAPANGNTAESRFDSGDSGGAAPGARWKQNAFWISFWVAPQVAESELDGRFAEIAEANFTGYLGFNGNSASPFKPNATRVAAEVALCDKYDLRCMPTLCGRWPPVDQSPCVGLGDSSPNFWGFQMLDEPGQNSFPSIGNMTKELEARRPGVLGYVNLLGDTPFASPDAYSAYIASYLHAVPNAGVLSMDFYTSFPPPPPPPASMPAPDETTPTPGRGATAPRRMPDSKDDYGQTLGVLRQQAETAPNGPIPFWAFFNAMPYDHGHSDPTEAMMRWQATTALAYGASGVMYFCYWSPDHVFALGGGLIVPRGAPNGTVLWQRGPHWYEAQRINSVLKVYGGFLLGRKSVGVYRANTTGGGVPFTVDNSSVPTPGCVVAKLGKSDRGDGDWLVGVFDVTSAARWGPTRTVPAGYTHAVMLQNQDENRNAWTAVTWAQGVDAAAVLELDAVHGTLGPLLDDSPWDTGLQVALDAGGARLFLVKAQHQVPAGAPEQ